MSDTLVALGLVLVIEGLLWALIPSFGVHLLSVVQEVPERSLRWAGAAAVVSGLFIVWLVRG